MIPEIDEVYAYDQGQFGLHVEHPEIDSKLQKTEFRYTQNKVPYKSNEGEIIRYVKTVEIDGFKRSLLMISKVSDDELVDKFFDKCLYDIGTSKLLEKFKMSGRKPKPLGLKYES